MFSHGIKISQILPSIMNIININSADINNAFCDSRIILHDQPSKTFIPRGVKSHDCFSTDNSNIITKVYNNDKPIVQTLANDTTDTSFNEGLLGCSLSSQQALHNFSVEIIPRGIEHIVIELFMVLKMMCFANVFT